MFSYVFVRLQIRANTRFVDCKCHLIALLLRTMPAHIIACLQLLIPAALSTRMVPTNSCQDNYKFPAIHFTITNHCSTNVCITPFIQDGSIVLTHCDIQGSTAPADTHPFELKLHAKEFNHDQLMPHHSNDFKLHKDAATNIQGVIGKLFTWIELAMRVFLLLFLPAGIH